MSYLLLAAALLLAVWPYLPRLKRKPMRKPKYARKANAMSPDDERLVIDLPFREVDPVNDFRVISIPDPNRYPTEEDWVALREGSLIMFREADAVESVVWHDGWEGTGQFGSKTYPVRIKDLTVSRDKPLYINTLWISSRKPIALVLDNTPPGLLRRMLAKPILLPYPPRINS